MRWSRSLKPELMQSLVIRPDVLEALQLVSRKVFFHVSEPTQGNPAHAVRNLLGRGVKVSGSTYRTVQRAYLYHR